MGEPIRFKFKHVNNKGEETGLLSKKGSFDGETLILDKTQIPILAVVRARRFSNRLILTLLQEDGSMSQGAIALTGGKTRPLLSAINVATSARWCELRQERLGRQGRQQDFRAAQCPHCQAMIDLTDRPDSPQLYCMYCGSISTHEGTPPADEGRYRQCESCDFYAQPQEFTEFIFYFLVVMYGWSTRKHSMCHSCMRRKAWKNLFANLLFVLGVPVAVWQLFRAYLGGSTLSPAFAGLDKANALAKHGKADRAAEIYDQIEHRLQHCAGVRFNHGFAYLRAGRWDQAVGHLERALADCSNYAPAYGALRLCYERLGRTEDLQSLRAAWGEQEEATAT
jgi:hypothetical protein